MVRQVLKYGIRIIYSLGIVVSGSLWLLACEAHIGGWWLGSRELQKLSLIVLANLTMIHFTLGLFPMRWAYDYMQRLAERYVPIHPVTPIEKE